MEQDQNYRQKLQRCSDAQVITYKITEQCDEDGSQISQNYQDETEIQDERRHQKYDSSNRNKINELTQQSIQQINQNYNKHVLNNQHHEDEENLNFSKNILSLHNSTRLNNTNLTIGSAIQNQRYQSIYNTDYTGYGGRYSPFKYQIDAEELRQKKQSLERETKRMEEEVKFLKSNLLSEIYKQKQYENSRLYNLIYIIYVAAERNKKNLVKECFHKLVDLNYGGLVKADKFREEKQFQKLYAMWNNWKNYMLDIKVNILRQLVKQKMINTEKVYERQSIQYHNKKLKAKSFAGWLYYFQKNKELLSKKRQRVNIHEIFHSQQSKDCSPIRSSSKNKGNDNLIYNGYILKDGSNDHLTFSNKKLSKSCKVCKVLDKKSQGNSACKGGVQCKNSQINAQNQNSNSQTNLKQKLLQSLNLPQNPSPENVRLQTQPEKSPSVSPGIRSKYLSKKTLQQGNNNQDPQFFQNKENIQLKEPQEKQYSSPQRKIQEVIANAKSKILQFQNYSGEQPFSPQKQNQGYLQHLNNENENNNNYSIMNNNIPQKDGITPCSQNIPKKQLTDSSKRFVNNENIFSTTLKKQKNCDGYEQSTIGKIKGSDIQPTYNNPYVQSSSFNQNKQMQQSQGYDPSPLKDSSSTYKNSYNQQMNIGSANTQDYYNLIQSNNGINNNQQNVCSPKFNTMIENRYNTDEIPFNTQEDEGYNISNINGYLKNQKQNLKNASAERSATKQNSGGKSVVPFTTFKQRSNSINQYCNSKPDNNKSSLYSQIASKRNTQNISKTQGNKKIHKPIETEGLSFISPNNQDVTVISNKSFYQETRSSSMKKRNDSVGKSLSNYFSQSRKNQSIDNNSMVFSFYHPTNSKNIRNLQKSPHQSHQIDDEQFIEEQQNEYNPISFENSLRKDPNLNLSIINGSHQNANKSGFLDNSLHNKILSPIEQDQNLKQIEKRAQSRKKRLEDLKKKQQDWKKQKQEQEKLNQEKVLEQEREQYQKEFREFQAIKKIQKKNKLTAEKQKQLEKENNEKAIQFYQKRIQKNIFDLFVENHECHGKLDTALEFYMKQFLKKVFKGFVNQTINEKDRQKIKEQAQLEKAITFYNMQQKRKYLGKIKIFTYESLVEKENFAKQREEMLMRTAFQSLFQQLPMRKKTEIDVDKVVIQFRKTIYFHFTIKELILNNQSKQYLPNVITLQKKIQ